MWLSRGEGDARCLEKIIRPVVNFTQDGFSYSTPGGGGRSSDHEEAERTPRQNSHVWFFFGREQKTAKERRDETRRGEGWGRRQSGKNARERSRSEEGDGARAMQAKWKRWVRTAERGDPERWGGRKAFWQRARGYTHIQHAHTHTETCTQSSLDLERAASFKAEVLWLHRY